MTITGGAPWVDLRHPHAEIGGLHGFVSPPEWTGYADLDWTRVGAWSTGGVWDYHEAPLRHTGVFVAGYETPDSSVPTIGTATYAGLAQGTVYFAVTQGSGAMMCNCAGVWLTGNATLTADFGARVLTGSLTNMWAGGDPWYDDPNGGPWNDVSFSSAIVGNRFSGTANVTNSPAGPYSMGASAAGTLEGRFFGPIAQEAGAVWTLFDGNKAAVGTLTGKRQ